MDSRITTCAICEQNEAVIDLYNYAICRSCKSKLGLHADQTILQNSKKFEASKGLAYEEDIQTRLTLLQKKFIKAEIKLLHILDRLEHLK